MNFPSSDTQIINIEKILSQFQQLTHTEMLFINTSLQLISKDNIVSNSQKIKNSFERKKLLTFFPLIANQSFAGFFMANLNSTSNILSNLYRSTLESISKSTFNVYYQKVEVLMPFQAKQLNKIINMFQIILSNYQGDEFTYHEIYTKSSQKVEINNINNALNYIEENIDQKLTLFDVSKQTYLSPAYLSRLFKKYFKINFSSYTSTCKITLAEELLITTKEPIDSIAKKIGFSRASYFNKVFKEKAGMTPLQFRKNYKGKKVYTIHRQIEWKNNISVYAISHSFFQEKGIPVQVQSINGYPFISSIGTFSSVNSNSGWIYTVDGIQPQKLPSEVYVKDKSVIQWIYIDY